MIVQRICIKTNCYEQVDTYATISRDDERKEEENEVVSYTEIRFEIFANRLYITNF